MLWVDRHRPKTLSEIELNPNLTKTLQRLTEENDVPHLLFYGPSGSGKKTRVMALLQEIYGPSVYSLRLEHRSVQATESKVVDIAALSSPHHIDINPSDAGNYDRVVIMQMIREIAQTAPLHVNSGSGKENAPVVPFKVVVLNEVDRMSKGAQHALRRTMEKYMRTCRIFLLCNSTSRLIPPLRSRCLGIRVPLHSQENISLVVKKVCEAEGRPMPSPAFLTTLTQRSGGNLRRAILMLEAAAMTKVDLAGNGLTTPQPDWKLYLDEIVSDILAEQTPKRLHEVRLKFYDLLGQCISGETILKGIVDGLLISVKPNQQMGVIELAAVYDHHMKLGTRPIVHLEAFIAGVMKLLKK